MRSSASWTALMTALVACLACAKSVNNGATYVAPDAGHIDETPDSGPVQPPDTDGGHPIDTPDAGHERDSGMVATDAGHVVTPEPDAGHTMEPDAGHVITPEPDAGHTMEPDAGHVITPDPDAGHPQPVTQPPVTASYNLVRKGSEKCLDVTGGGSADGTLIIQYWCNGGINQRFIIDSLGGGLVRFMDANTKKCIDVTQSGTSDGTQIQLWTCNNTSAQSFYIEDLDNGYARIRNSNANKCIDIYNGSGDDGAKVELYTCNGGDAQSFQFKAPYGDPGDNAPLYTNQAGNIVTMTTGNVRIDYDLSKGTADFYYAGHKKLAGFYAGVQLDSYITSQQYTKRTFAANGNQVVITSTADNLPMMQQLFNLSGGHRFLARVMVYGNNISTNWIAPIVVSQKGGVNVGMYQDPRLLWVPFDNDAWVSYNAAGINNNNNGTSFEAAAFYDNNSRNGIVVGSVLHDTWKTGVYYSGANNRLSALNVFGGATDATWTRDKVAHAKVTGNTLYSPFVFVGYGPDFRDLFEEFADVNAFYENKLPWSGGVPFGWNSWGKIQDKITYDKAIAVSDFFKNSLQNADFNNNGTVYINLDSFWDNMSDDQLAQFVAHAKANGQKAGIYWGPFADWGKSARQLENSNYNYSDTWIRDQSNNPVELDGAFAMDPTHPGTKARVDYFIDRFKKAGFEYVKLDFLTHGALETTARYSPSSRTGTQAYNEGMAYIRDRIAGTMFISESIAPLFPYRYAHARRVACDTYGAARGSLSSQYELNSASFGWWLSGRLYSYNDPDNMVFEGFSAQENMTRLMSAVVTGTVFLNGDDLTGASANAQNLAKTYLTNPRINAVARIGRPFRPVEANTGTNPSELMVLVNGSDTYLAVFNFSGNNVSKTVDLARVGLNASKTYTATDLWSNAASSATGTLKVDVEKDSARLFVLR